MIMVCSFSSYAQSKFDYVNVKEYGAKADGKSDDTQAIQKALAAAVKKGGICFLPTGSYRLNGSLIVPKGSRSRGAMTEFLLHRIQ
jgi:polygalacturonase